jgi:hypothetical protein
MSDALFQVPVDRDLDTIKSVIKHINYGETEHPEITVETTNEYHIFKGSLTQKQHEILFECLKQKGFPVVSWGVV